jgi:hypothetical protein
VLHQPAHQRLALPREQHTICVPHSGLIIGQQHRSFTAHPTTRYSQPSLFLTHALLSAGGARTDRLAHSRAFLAAAAVAPAEGIADLTTSLAQQLQQGSGVRGLLLHGVGGIGKTTLAAHIARSMQPPSAAAAAAGRFAGGVYCVSIQAGAADNVLARDQVRLLVCMALAS